MALLRFLRRYLFVLYLLVAVWMGLAILAMQVPGHLFWPAGFIAMTLPVALTLNLGMLVYWLLRKSWRVVFPLGLTLLLWNYYDRGVSLNMSEVEADSTTTFTVMSYNVRVFNKYNHLHEKDMRSSTELMKFVKEAPADVLCLQEVYNHSKSDIYNAVRQIKTTHPYHYLSSTYTNRIGAQFGIAVFSKFPIVGKGVLSFGKLSQNHAMYVDLVRNQDTVRVYNFHLQSMSIKDQDVPDATDEEITLKKKSSNIFGRLKRGFESRSHQVQELLSSIESSKYPVVACGDLNDVPYSYSYEKMNDELTNAFAEAGWGIGVTYRGKIPLLRIDNHFFSKGLRIHDFDILSEVNYTDHYPTVGRYSFKSKF